MKLYETREQPLKTHVGTVCDGCGGAGDDTDGTDLHEVVISVDEGEEGGSLDVYDYCDMCLGAWAPLLKAAGSRAPVVTGEPVPPTGGDDE